MKITQNKLIVVDTCCPFEHVMFVFGNKIFPILLFNNNTKNGVVRWKIIKISSKTSDDSCAKCVAIKPLMRLN